MIEIVFNRLLYIVLLPVIISTFLVSCSGRHVNNIDKIISEHNEIITNANRFSLVVTDSCTILTIKDPWQGAAGIKQTYYLINRDNTQTLIADPSQIIYVPVRNVMCMSTTHLAMITALNEQHTITGVSGSNYVYDEKVIDLINKGQIKNIGYESGLNNELILKISPELVILYGIGGESAGYTAKINELGIKTLFDADYLEENPLGKAEWIKIFGALYCKEEMADSIFMSVAESYNQLKGMIKKRTEGRPKVLLGLPFRDTWYISPGNSYISQLISDAGGTYLWSDTESSISMPYGLEDVFMRANEADFWLNIGTVASKDEILSVDTRLQNLSCFTQGNLYNNNKRISLAGGNDYWESGSIYPNVILNDIAVILHPELFEENELFYYQKLK